MAWLAASHIPRAADCRTATCKAVGEGARPKPDGHRHGLSPSRQPGCVRPARAGDGRLPRLETGVKIAGAYRTMQNNTFETLMGAVVILVAAGFLYFAYTSTSVGSLGGYELGARFASADGIATGTDVRLHGIKIGRV